LQDCSGSRERFTGGILCVGAPRALCRIYILLRARAREAVRGRNCFPIITGHRRFPGMPPRRSEIQEAALKAILLRPLCVRPRLLLLFLTFFLLLFLFNFPLLFSILLSSYFYYDATGYF